MGLSFAAPLAGRDAGDLFYRAAGQDFNPRTPCGVRQLLQLCNGAVYDISIHAPLAGCDQQTSTSTSADIGFQSTHPLRGATGAGCAADGGDDIFQSTHPLRGATRMRRQYRRAGRISIHAPLAGCDSFLRSPFSNRFLFQSTHPLRGATHTATTKICWQIDFNPRTPCGVRLPDGCQTVARWFPFQSTHPLRGATWLLLLASCRFPHFNPRTPCGVRRG